MSNFDPMYNQTAQGWRQPSYSAPQNFQPQITTNVIFVTSPEEALIKTNVRNSDMIYFDQDKNVFYRVKVDMEGKKSWAQFSYTLPDQSATTPATQADIQELLSRIETLEKSMLKTSKTNTRKNAKEVPDNGELDG